MARKDALTGLKPGKRPREEPAQEEGGDKEVKSPKTRKAAFSKKTAAKKKSEEKKKIDKLTKFVENGKGRHFTFYNLVRRIQLLPTVGTLRRLPRKSEMGFKRTQGNSPSPTFSYFHCPLL